MTFVTNVITFSSSQVSWYVGEVITYLVHKHGGRVFHLAVLSLVEHSDMNEYGVPIVTCFANHQDSKIVVCDVSDIITSAGFIRFNTNERQFKVIWEGVFYYKR